MCNNFQQQKCGDIEEKKPKTSPAWLKQDMGRANRMQAWQVDELPPEDDENWSGILAHIGMFHTKKEAIKKAYDQHWDLGGRWHVRLVDL